MTGGNYVISIDEFERKFPKPIRAERGHFWAKQMSLLCFIPPEARVHLKTHLNLHIPIWFHDILTIRTDEKLENISWSQVRIGVSPQPTEHSEYKNNSCTLKLKTEFSFDYNTDFFFFNLSDYFFQKLKLKFFPLSKSGNSMLFYWIKHSSESLRKISFGIYYPFAKIIGVSYTQIAAEGCW